MRLKQSFIPSQWLVSLGVFVMVTCGLLIANQQGLIQPFLESGDYAANSLLIQDAKRLDLCVGHYSRMGFNHPGPALLYVLGMGELLFYDALHWVSAPVAGQMIAACLFNAAWIAAIVRLLRRWDLSGSLSLLMLSVFLCTTAHYTTAFFTDLWFPYLYYFPFAVFVLALSRLVAGYLDATLALALSTGCLLNGHIAFAPVLSMMLGMVVLHHVLRARQLPCDARLLRHFLLFAGIQVLFLMPLLIETVRHFPEPLASYVGYHGSPHHNLKPIFKFMADYWGGSLYFGWGVLVMSVVSLRPLPGSPSNSLMQPLMIVLSIATLAVLVYVIYGVDSLAYAYLAYFYEAVPCLFMMIPSKLVLDRVIKKPLLKERAALALAAVFLLWTVSHILLEKTTLAEPVAASDVQAMYQFLLKHHTSDKKIVLDLDAYQRTDYSDLWVNILALELYATRQHLPLFCIHKHWELLFTKAARCSQADLVDAVRWSVRSVNQRSTQSVAFKGSQIAFVPYVSPNIVNQGLLTPHHNVEAFSMVLDNGWAVPDADFVWSDQDVSTLILPVYKGFQGHVLLDLQAFLAPKYPEQQVSIYLENRKIKQLHFDLNHNRRIISLLINDSKTDLQTLTIRVNHIISPAQAGVAADSRRLGVALYGIDVRSAS